MTVYVLTYNEALMLPFFIAHYRRNFPGCRIVVYDNGSDDDTVDIAVESGCLVSFNNTNGQLDDIRYLEIKNNCWKADLPADITLRNCPAKEWVIIADCDELLDVNAADIAYEESVGTTLIKGKGYNMVNMSTVHSPQSIVILSDSEETEHSNIAERRSFVPQDDNKAVDCGPWTTDPSTITHGVRDESYDKIYCFDTRKITGINYLPGAHLAKPEGKISYAQRAYVARHYKYLSPEHMIAKYAQNAARLSDSNRRFGYGRHYLQTPEYIHAEFENQRKQAIKLISNQIPST